MLDTKIIGLKLFKIEISSFMGSLQTETFEHFQKSGKKQRSEHALRINTESTTQSGQNWGFGGLKIFGKG
jgi:hypothetical protein